MATGDITTQDIFRMRVFSEPLIPIGSDPSPAENATLSAALQAYSQRASQDDFSGLTGYLEAFPNSPWAPALLTQLGREYYHTGHYSKTLDVWLQAWQLTSSATDLNGKIVADQAGGELASMYARLGRMSELEEYLKSVEGRVFTGPATGRIVGAREGLFNMQTRPEESFKCGPLALYSLKLFLEPKNAGTDIVRAAQSTRDGCSLGQVADLSQTLGLNLQMAFRDPSRNLSCHPSCTGR